MREWPPKTRWAHQWTDQLALACDLEQATRQAPPELESLVYTPTWGGELTLDRAQAQRALRHVIFSRYQDLVAAGLPHTAIAIINGRRRS